MTSWLLESPPPWTESFELLHGIAGIAVYFLERLTDVSAYRAKSWKITATDAIRFRS